jgi:predicted MarR family transcription regulator
MNIPQDPFILLSYINTKLRDRYRSLDDLCRSLNIDRNHLESVLSSIDYTYTKEQNRFIRVM